MTATKQELAPNPASPYRYHRPSIGEQRYDAWAADQVSRIMADAAGTFSIGDAAIAWNPLPWDSSRFGFPAARIDALVASDTGAALSLLRDVTNDCRRRGIRHLIARVDVSSIHLSQALACSSFELIDGIQTFSMNVPVGPAELPLGTRLATVADADAVGVIARESFIYDRFHNDRALTPEIADLVNETWARNSVLGTAADAVLLSPGSFVTCKVDHSSKKDLGLSIASIPLVATAAGHRGKGAARKATEAALAWCRQQQVDIVEVGTQLANVPAARLYQSAGFRTTSISLTYRLIL